MYRQMQGQRESLSEKTEAREGESERAMGNGERESESRRPLESSNLESVLATQHPRGRKSPRRRALGTWQDLAPRALILLIVIHL